MRTQEMQADKRNAAAPVSRGLWLAICESASGHRRKATDGMVLRGSPVRRVDGVAPAPQHSERRDKGTSAAAEFG